ncbi:MAG: polysulfide reductase NrfD [Acidobacteriota bacterium]|nr:MAG: polysulfide reductase NrfD [Acidobacteriota bacterium]
MLEKALKGSPNYWGGLGILGVVMLIGLGAYLKQYDEGLTVTGLSRDIPWGFYIAQFTFLVGVAASAVMVVLPYYLHDYKAFGRVTVIGEFLAIAAVSMCMLFIFVDMGQPLRVLNLMLYPSPNSLMFWDFVVMTGYLLLNVVITQVTFGAERKGVAPPNWIRPVIILSIPWAISIHTVTAFLYSGLEARAFWMTAILAPRFLASAFASGPALLIILCTLVGSQTNCQIGGKAIQKLRQIVTYALAVNIFFVLVELFTGIYSHIPEHMEHFQYLFFGLEGRNALVPWMWTSQVLGVGALVLLLLPVSGRNQRVLLGVCVAVITSIWIEKGLGMVVTGFIPSPLGGLMEYFPTVPEILISLGIYATGLAILTVLLKIATTIREELETA